MPIQLPAPALLFVAAVATLLPAEGATLLDKYAEPFVHGACYFRTHPPATNLRYTWDTDHMYYFIHLPKTGGGTMEAEMKDLSVATGVPLCPVNIKAKKLPRAKPYFKSHPNANCSIVAYEGTALEATYFPKQPLILTILREPLSRGLSWFNAEAKTGRHKYESFAEAVRLKFSKSPMSMQHYKTHYGSFMTQKLDPNPSASKKTQLSRAIEFLRGAAFVGLTEHFRTSNCLLYYTFRLQHHFDNCHTERLMQVHHSDNGTRVTLDDLRAMSSWMESDQTLYGYATALFRSRVHQMALATGIAFAPIELAHVAALAKFQPEVDRNLTLASLDCSDHPTGEGV